MAKYELLDTIQLAANNTILQTPRLPELVHLDDSAFTVMVDFSKFRPETIPPSLPMIEALNEMKNLGTHFLLVKSHDHIVGLISTEDILGAKPIQIIQERRIKRHLVTAKMLMTPIQNIIAFKLKSIRYAKVGNVVQTLKKLNHKYALVIDDDHEDEKNYLYGMFSIWQISRQLHTNVSDSISKA